MVWKRSDAERIARDHLAASGGFATGDVVFRVRTLAEIVESGLCGPCLYAPESLHKSLASSWLVYVLDRRPFVFKSSWIVVVSRTDGAVLYSGSAYDEG
jgi:hypothetical protein